jgi:atypical dual specificity phosphatase
MKNSKAAMAASKLKRTRSAPQLANHVNDVSDIINSERKRKLGSSSSGGGKQESSAKKLKTSVGSKSSRNGRKTTRKLVQKSGKTSRKSPISSSAPSSKVATNGDLSNGSKQCADAKKPPKFSYVVDGLLAGMGRPTQHGHMQFLCDNGFRYLVTLTLNKPRTIQEYPGNGLQWVHIPIQDETPPSLDQIKTFVALVDKAKQEKTSVAVHCAWGRGRTGTMLACYLAKINKFSLNAAIEEIRRLRPGSVDTDKQKNAIDGAITYWRSN